MDDLHLVPERKEFTVEYLGKIIDAYVDEGYEFLTCYEFFSLDPELRKRKFILRFDVDAKPERLPAIIECISKRSIKISVFWQVHGDYNPFFHENYSILKQLSNDGHEIGLHSNFVEFAKYFDENPLDVLVRERRFLEVVTNSRVFGHSCHRDVNYLYNSLPYLREQNLASLGFEYSAYDEIFNDSKTLYLNEGLNPHLTWRSLSPEEALKSQKNICLLLHPHWWHTRFHVGL
jgi:hypothetical protein